LIHIEDPESVVTSEEFFRRKTAVFEELAKTLHGHGGFLTIQPELEWITGANAFMPGVPSQLVKDYNVVYSTHTHGPVCVDEQTGIPYGNKACSRHPEWSPHITDDDVVTYIADRVDAIEAAANTTVTDHNGQWDWANFYLVEQAGIKTVAAYKYEQRSFDTLITNPWRPAQTPPKTDAEGYFVHDPDGPVIFLPGVGQSVSKYDERIDEEVSRYMAQYIALADPDRVNTLYIVTHVDHFYSLNGQSPSHYIKYNAANGDMALSPEFESHLAYWDDLLTDLVDPLVAGGYVQWASLPEMGEAYEEWEANCGS
ncbi:MAG: hypothetical protein HN348_31675, partial [Proteobacteria bacterium]|nr:hypothetical protein [Pseudomonadota bacterium]